MARYESMSWQASEWAATVSAPSGVAKCVLLVLAQAADPAGCTILGNQEIARRAQFSRRAVVSALQAMEAAQLIGRERRFRPVDGGRTSDRIRLFIGEGAAAVLSAPDASRPTLPSAPPARGQMHVTTRPDAPDDAPKCTRRTVLSHGIDHGVGPIRSRERWSALEQAIGGLDEGAPDHGAPLRRSGTGR